jgi:F-type H+-transporting ATPase subunit epsilon
MINVQILTRENKVLDTAARRATILTTTGEITILRGHEPIISTISDGKISVEVESGEVNTFLIFYGVVHVENIKGKTNLIVLVEEVTDTHLESSESIKEAKVKARIALKEKDDDFKMESRVFLGVNRFKQRH